jgi:glyoxylase-like metal-dependent hydrolase (beta-lactamase superfamily II)
MGMRKLPAVILFIFLTACSGPATEPEATRVEGRGTETENWYDKLPRSQWAQYERVKPETPWFEIYKIRPDVYAIYEPGQFEEVISFLIIGEWKALLFDSGIGVGDMKAAVRSLTDLPVTLVNSHSHYDHVGSNHQFDDLVGVDNDYAIARRAGIAKDIAAEFIQPAWMGKVPLPPGFDSAAYSIPSYSVDTTAYEHMKIGLGGRTLEVVLVPGHSPDSLALIDREKRELYIGDTFYLAPLYAHIEGSDFEDYRASAKKLEKLVRQVDFVMTAHNVPIVAPEYLVRMREAFDAIAAGNEKFEISDGAREYKFGDFSVLLPDE